MWDFASEITLLLGQSLPIINNSIFLLELILTGGQKSVKKLKVTFSQETNSALIVYTTNAKNWHRDGLILCKWQNKQAYIKHCQRSKVCPIEKDSKSHNHIFHRTVNSISSMTHANRNYQRVKGSFTGLPFCFSMLFISIIFKYCCISWHFQQRENGWDAKEDIHNAEIYLWF